MVQTATFVNHAYDAELTDVGPRKSYSTFSLTSSAPVTYSWENIKVYSEKKRSNCFAQLLKKAIITNVTGCVAPGELLAILGASGAGKTTLLQVSAYVQQSDLFLPTLTVKEHLQFQAMLRMDEILSYEERMMRVTQAIQELGLMKCADTIIGSAESGIKGISGGERKRLAFASEILTNPSLIFCDEPTSGLDSYMALNIIQVLKIALSGKAVVCSIHQPSSDVFSLFDRILLMAEGRTAYLGPITDALSFFSSQSLHCPPNYNPAHFYIRMLAAIPGEESESKKKIKDICDAYESSEANRLVLAAVEANHSTNSSISRLKNHEEKDEFTGCKLKKHLYKVSWLVQFRVVFWRSIICVFRQPTVLKVKIIQTICISVMVALIFQGHALKYANIRNIQGGILILLSNVTFIGIYGVVSIITSELPIFLREHRTGMYRTDVYFLSKSLADLPVDFLFPLVFTLITYHAMGLNVSADRFFIACGILIFVLNAVTSFGYFVSFLFRSTHVAINSITPLVTSLLYIGGFYMQNGAIPFYLDWMRYLSWFMYGNEALSINQWDGVTFNETACSDGVCMGENILEDYDYNPDFFYRDIIGLCGLIVGFRLLAFFALLVKTYGKD